MVSCGRLSIREKQMWWDLASLSAESKRSVFVFEPIEEAIRSKYIATRNKCLTTSNKKLVETMQYSVKQQFEYSDRRVELRRAVEHHTVKTKSGMPGLQHSQISLVLHALGKANVKIKERPLSRSRLIPASSGQSRLACLPHVIPASCH